MLALLLVYLEDEDDKKWFENIFYTYRKQMISLAISILQNIEDAEDAVHDVFLRIATKNMHVARRIKDKKDLRNYLLKATKNTALNIIRKRKRGPVSEDVVFEKAIDEIEDLSDDKFLKVICDRSEYEAVIQAIKSLGEKYRDTLYYHYVLELTVHETAKLMNQTVSATKQQLVRGKKMLLNLLKIEGDEKNGN